MNNIGMYPLKPVYDKNIELQIPKCIYEMSNLHRDNRSTGLTPPDTGSVDQDDPLMALERRQERILQKLERLKSEVESLSQKSQERASSVSQAPSGSTITLGDGLHDVVINADPEKPPLSLFVLHQLLIPRARTCTSVHVHSSVDNVSNKLKKCLLDGSPTDRGNAQLAFTLIWKNVSHGPEMNVSPISQTPIQGEANIARYFARLLDPSYECNAELASHIDMWLDLASHSLCRGSSKEKAAAMRALNSHLGKNKWLVGSSLSLADVVTWSAVYQADQASAASNNVKKWLHACEDHSAFQHAKTLID
ncbi:aminoacyl tRNA synthase complex-interacting multifunctional protein 2-like [Ptychodera flava]|uniref:aminoacyl tRNA synthase complex-interacting multifunctional protein 2-like n=1 Tax=Ptychodera flava TaxID=63121 RepID=UPI00396AAFF4